MIKKFTNSFFVLAVTSFKAVLAIQTFDHCINPGDIALTFDDGPSIEYTNIILSILDKANVKATFFISGEDSDLINNSEAKEIIQKEYDNGHVIASHTYSHPVGINELSAEQLRDDVNALGNTIYDIIGVKPAFFRPPHGEYNDENLKVLERDCNISANILWNLDSEDWNNESDPLEQYKNVLEGLEPSSNSFIALNHDTEKDTALVNLINIIDYIKSLGYNFVTMGDCIGMNPYQNSIDSDVEIDTLNKRLNENEDDEIDDMDITSTEDEIDETN